MASKMSELAVKKSSVLISRASVALKYLHGTINVYKPAKMRVSTVISAIKTNLCKDLNEMTLNEPKPIVQIDSNNNGRYSIQLVPNLGQHILATGPRYNVDQLKIIAAHHLGYFTSGVLVLGVNKGLQFANYLKNGAPIQTFHVTGKFGKTTNSGFQGDHITMRASYRHVTEAKIQALLSSLQATYQKQMFEMSGVDVQSQAAYELACKGLIRPQNTKHVVIYGIRNIEYTRRTFTMEVQAMNATEDILANLVLEIALQLHTVAYCTKIRCTRFGYFSFEDSVLRSHWNLQNVLKSMHECQKIWNEHPSMVGADVSMPVGHEDDFKKT